MLDKKTLEMIQDKRFVYYIPADAYDEKRGYRVSVVFENVRGHFPTDWYWGHDYQKAKATAQEMNAEMGYTKDEAYDVVGSSMFNTVNGKIATA